MQSTRIDIEKERRLSNINKKYQRNLEILSMFGFKSKDGNLTNEEDALGMSFTLEEVKRILSLSECLMDRIRLKLFLKKKFSISYWQVYSLEKSSLGTYYFDYRKHSWLER